MTERFNVANTMANLEAANILISYSGYLSDQTLEGVSQGIKAIFETGALKTRKARKIFSVFVESAQNIIFYSGRRMEIGYLVVLKAIVVNGKTIGASKGILTTVALTYRIFVIILTHHIKLGLMKDFLSEFGKTILFYKWQYGKMIWGQWCRKA